MNFTEEALAIIINFRFEASPLRKIRLCSVDRIFLIITLYLSRSCCGCAINKAHVDHYEAISPPGIFIARLKFSTDNCIFAKSFKFPASVFKIIN